MLNVPRNASSDQIRKSFRKLSRNFHPDLHPGDEYAKQKFLELNQAYDVLQNSDSRRKYDIYGSEYQKIEQNMQRQNKPDIKMFLWVNLEDLYMSKIFKYQMKKLVFCPFCRGSGAQSPKDIHLCQNCQGKGQVHTRIQVRPGFYQQGMEMCHYCQGQGRQVHSVCEVCKGQKLQEGYEQKEFLLEKGMPENHEIVLKEQSDESLDNVAQNLVYIVKTIPHPQMIRRNDDLYLNFYINLKEALLGFEREITHLDGHVVKISKESISQQGETIKVEKEGMPKYQTPSEFGDLYVQLHIRMPYYLSPEQKQILKNTL